MTFWETGYNRGGSRGGAWGARAPLLFLGQTEAQRAEKIFWRPHPHLSRGLDDRAAPLYLKVWIRHCIII